MGARFKNLEPTKANGLVNFLKWQLTRNRGPWKRLHAAEPGPKPPESVPAQSVRVTFINHASVLIQMDGLNILTDPIWSKRVSPVPGIGPARLRPPGIRFQDLPTIDAVLVSHNHYDHLDLPTLRRLGKAHRPKVIAGSGTAAFLRRRRVPNGVDLGWWQTTQLGGGVRVTAVPARHWSGRKLVDRNQMLWCGFVVEGSGGRVYYAGDTAWGVHFEQIAARFAPFRLAVLPIGSYKPEWFMSKSHISPVEAVRAHELLKAGTSVGVHFGTFALADDGQDEPVRDLEAALAQRTSGGNRFWVLDFGEGRDVPPL